MIKSIKVKLEPNNVQLSKLFQYAGTSRFIYNWTLERQNENYKNGGKFVSDNDLRKELTQLKKKDDFNWLTRVSNNVAKQAVKDACESYKRFFNGVSSYPKFKTRKKSKPSFYQDNGRIKFTRTHVKIEGFTTSKKKNKQKINWIKLAEKNRVPFEENIKYYNPRFTFDGLNWWISVGVDSDVNYYPTEKEGVGIDLGVKDLAFCSDGTIYKNINKSSKIKKLEKRMRRLQRKISKKYQSNKEGESYQKTCNIIKTEKQCLKFSRRLTNIRKNYLHQITSETINRKPRFIVLEDLNVKGLMKNKHLSKAIQQQLFYEFRRQVEYKCRWNNIEFILADRWFPSSKLCYKCGQIKKDLKLSDRIYECDCGNKIDRDYQASLNLKEYGERFLKSIN